MFKELFVYVVIYEYMINIDEGLMKMVDDRGTTFQARYNRHRVSIAFDSRYFNVCSTLNVIHDAPGDRDMIE